LFQERCVKNTPDDRESAGEMPVLTPVAQTQERPESSRRSCGDFPVAPRQLADVGVGPGTCVPLVVSSTGWADPIWIGATGAGGTSEVTGSITSVTF
jgi:hypothetical protein